MPLSAIEILINEKNDCRIPFYAKQLGGGAASFTCTWRPEIMEDKLATAGYRMFAWVEIENYQYAFYTYQ
jgi:hypothetical protein